MCLAMCEYIKKLQYVHEVESFLVMKRDEWLSVMAFSWEKEGYKLIAQFEKTKMVWF